METHFLLVNISFDIPYIYFDPGKFFRILPLPLCECGPDRHYESNIEQHWHYAGIYHNRSDSDHSGQMAVQAANICFCRHYKIYETLIIFIALCYCAPVIILNT